MQVQFQHSSAPHASSVGSRTRAVLPILAALVLAGIIVWRAGQKCLLDITSVEACSSLAGRAGQLCSSYHTAVGPDKFTAAVHWRQLSPATYACSGVTVDCLQVDMRSSIASSSCQPLTEGSACTMEQQQQQLTCSRGFCGGPPLNVEVAEPSYLPGINSALAPVRFAAQQQQQRRHWALRLAKYLTPPLVNPEPVVPDSAELAPPRFLQQVTVSAQVNPSWPTAYGYVKFNDAGQRVPETFLATSHEWTRLTDYAGANAQAWAQIFRMMSSSPVIRLGGASQDRLIDPPGDSTWMAMAKLQRMTNARFIIGLPLFPKNAVKMCRQMIAQSKKYLGSSVIGYELGNEPEFWPAGLGGYDDAGNWQAGFGPYSRWFDKVARTLNPCGTTPVLSGPGWGNVNTQDPNWFRITLRNGKACGYLWESNTHYYPYIDNTTVTAEQLLGQDLQDFGLSKFNAYYNIAKWENNLALRISEANSLYGGGRANLSDTMAGTLWVADALFAFANAGARAFHLHWGLGGQPFEGGAPNVGVQTNFDYNTPPPYEPYPSVHAPWYGYLFWVSASAGGYNKMSDSQFVAAWVERNAPNTSATGGGNSSKTAASDFNKRVATTNPKQQQKIVQEKAAAPGKKPQNSKQAVNSAKQAGNTGNAKNTNKKAAGTPPSKAQAGKQQQQNQKGRRLLAADQLPKCDANIKIWALKAGDNTLRLAILNKDSSKACNMKIMIPDAPRFCSQGQTAELSRLLPGPQGINAKAGLSWQGQHYDDSSVATSGKLAGSKAVAAVYASQDGGGCSYIIGMPQASAAMLVVKAVKR